MNTDTVPTNIDATLQQAIHCHQLQQWQEAERLYKLILSVEPDHPDANHNLGILAYTFGHTGIARQFLQKALDRQKDNPQYWKSLGKVLLAANHPVLARKTFTDGILLFFESGHHANVELLAREIVTHWPAEGFGWKALGTALCLQNKNEDALPALREATRLMPDNAEAFNSLGNACKAIERHGEALTAYRQAIALKPDYPQPLNSLSTLLMDMGRFGESFHLMRRLSLAAKTAQPDQENSAPRSAGEEAYERCRRALGLPTPPRQEPVRKPMPPGMGQYYVSKGWEGFCDRFTCLSQCINQAIRYKRILYVDWTDRIWSHGDSGFFDYFDLIDLPYVVSAEAIPPRLKTYPGAWSDCLDLPADEWVHKFKEKHPFVLKSKYNTYPVWVHPGIGFRKYDYRQMARHLRLNARTAAALAPLLEAIPQDLPVVHLRGTDRPVDEAQWHLLRQSAPRACVVSDDVRLAERWMNESPDSVLLSDTLVSCNAGGHKLTADELRRNGLDKPTMNIRLLADFICLATAKDALPLNTNSVFFKVARNFGSCDGISSLLQPAPEASLHAASHAGYHYLTRTTRSAPLP